MNAPDLLELERLAAKHSPEILRSIPYLLPDEISGHLAYLRRIDAEQGGSEG